MAIIYVTIQRWGVFYIVGMLLIGKNWLVGNKFRWRRIKWEKVKKIRKIRNMCKRSNLSTCILHIFMLIPCRISTEQSTYTLFFTLQGGREVDNNVHTYYTWSIFTKSAFLSVGIRFFLHFYFFFYHTIHETFF